MARTAAARGTISVEGDRWYGRGTADNKGQHTINLAALEQVIAARGGKLGYDAKMLSRWAKKPARPGSTRSARAHRDALAADVLIASDGPRARASRPTMFLGSRGAFNFDLHVKLRDGGHHSGNWGGLLRNPGIRLAHALAEPRRRARPHRRAGSAPAPIFRRACAKR